MIDHTPIKLILLIMSKRVLLKSDCEPTTSTKKLKENAKDQVGEKEGSKSRRSERLSKRKPTF